MVEGGVEFGEGGVVLVITGDVLEVVVFGAAFGLVVVEVGAHLLGVGLGFFALGLVVDVVLVQEIGHFAGEENKIVGGGEAVGLFDEANALGLILFRQEFLPNEKLFLTKMKFFFHQTFPPNHTDEGQALEEFEGLGFEVEVVLSIFFTFTDVCTEFFLGFFWLLAKELDKLCWFTTDVM